MAAGAAAFVLSALVTGLVRRWALGGRMLDRPNARSSHRRPTARGGGLGPAAAFLLALIVGQGAGVVSPLAFWGLALSGVAVAAVGFADDRDGVAPGWRLTVHFLAAGWLLVAAPGWRTLDFGAVALDWSWWGAIAVWPAAVWSINLYNFMDGIDGLAGVEAFTILLAAGVVFWPAGGTELCWLSWTLAAAVGGFLVWNWPPALIFMGDVGSGFLGLVLAGLALIAATAQPHWLWAWVIWLGLFEVDATVTLIRRFARREKVYQAHREHAYQRLARAYGHRGVALGAAAINAVWLTPWAALTVYRPGWIVPALIVSLSPLVAAAIAVGSGRPEGAGRFP
jgi:Fuc2NAc and GlcNAc transferase